MRVVLCAAVLLALAGCRLSYSEKIARCGLPTVEAIGDPDVQRRFQAILPHIDEAYARGGHPGVRLALDAMPRDVVFAIASVCADEIDRRSRP